MRRAFAAVAPKLTALGFYLGGGTAVALHYGHRRSVDLDWFRPEGFEPLDFAQRLRQQGVELEAISIAENTLIARLQGTKLSLFAYPYPLVAPLYEWQEYHARIASPEDLVCMKLAAVQQRGTKRDFVDLYVLLQHIPLKTAVQLYAQKFNTAEVASLIYALTYFDDADAEPRPRLRIDLSWRKVKAFLREQARQVCL
ncbi:MAG: nucleotidyl transferase AbiEii/AbiGii toxin family protein [Fimbriimonadales bacterium]|nr:nucleotidyl transferase AbiEii/AbiGii toxin family protein [Fimbriimonadales bacterium]